MVVQELEMLFERASNGEGLSLLFIDVDNFKLVNDADGHDVGDQVLKHVAELTGDSLRLTDTVGRYGGEEFLVGLPGCAAQDAEMIADRDRLKVQSQ